MMEPLNGDGAALKWVLNSHGETLKGNVMHCKATERHLRAREKC